MEKMPVMTKHITFTQIWDNYQSFKTDYDANPMKAPIPSARVNNAIEMTFYLLYANYGNSEIINRDVNQFKFKLFSIIYKYGAFWDKKLELQDKLMNLSDDELRLGSKAIYNKAFNPNTTPSTDELEEIPFINEQQTTNYKKSKAEAYITLWDSMRSSATDDYVRKFRSLFSTFVGKEKIPYYISEEEDDE